MPTTQGARTIPSMAASQPLPEVARGFLGLAQCCEDPAAVGLRDHSPFPTEAAVAQGPPARSRDAHTAEDAQGHKRDGDYASPLQKTRNPAFPPFKVFKMNGAKTVPGAKPKPKCWPQLCK